jgi:outer membrane receptor protein involved in Fe transport
MRGRAFWAALGAWLAAPLSFAQPADQVNPSTPASQTVEVVGTAPLSGLGVPRARLPYTSATVRRTEMDQAQAETLSDHLARRLAGMQSSDIQGSPYQAELNYRGYRASSLLGAAQGLAVFLDGVRINEPFGDVVLWDLVPEFALRSVTAVPGANPAFGLNALGGAIALETADGLNATGTRAQLSGGSFGRRRVELANGQRWREGWHSYVGVSHFAERGWREHSPGEVSQLFAKLGQSGDPFSWHATLLGARSHLTGNGLVPAYTLENGVREENLYEGSPRAIYTYPDPSGNRLLHLSLHAEAQVQGARVQALAYTRGGRRHALNSDFIESIDPARPDVTASLNSTATQQRASGLAASVAARSGSHQWQVGLNADRTRTHFEQFEQEASFDANRGAMPGAEAAELSVRVVGRTQQWGLYATDTWSRLAAGGWNRHVTTTLRSNQARVSNALATVDDATGTLSEQPQESFRYRSLNPALGVVQELGNGWAAGWAVYANLARNTRVPTVIELGCANPEVPCRLPAGLQSDPYLAQVRSTSAEAGWRWRQPGMANPQSLEISLHRTDNTNDIVFGSTSANGQLGYFRNVPRTRHQGAEVTWAGRSSAWEWSLALAWLRATYQARDTLRQGPRNVAVEPGTAIAGLPNAQAKWALDWRATPTLTLGLDAQWIGARAVQGNEDGRAEDSEPVRPLLRTAAYSLLDWRASWRPQAGIEWFARVRNLLDQRYENFGSIGRTRFDAQGRFNAEGRTAVFVGPGAPRSLQAGLRWTWR